MVQFLYAQDESGKMVNIKDAKGKDSKFFCPNCKDEMIPRCGNKNAWHFAHKNAKCQYDQYLHTLAEIKIQEWWNSSEEVNIVLAHRVLCPEIEKCIFYNRISSLSRNSLQKEDEIKCEKLIKRKHNLKELYGKCEQEEWFEGFRADLLCPNLLDKYDPLFFEICVTHQCEREKIDSGIKIIEFLIESEDDVDALIGNTIEEGDKIRFYNFHPTEEYSKSPDVIKKVRLAKLTIDSSRKYYVDTTSVSCENYKQRKGEIEITTILKGADILQRLSKENAFELESIGDVRHCCVCRYRSRISSKVCSLSEKYHPGKLHYGNARKCQMFKRDKDLEKEKQSALEEYKKDHPVDIWVREKEEK